jgi:hypothetical protein
VVILESKKMRALIYSTFSVVAGGAVWYTALNRTPAQFLDALPWIGVIFAVLLLKMVAEKRVSLVSLNLTPVNLFGLEYLLVIVGGGVIFYSIGVTAIDGAIALSKAKSTYLVIPGTLMAGGMLFLFRYFLRALYGVTEILVGLQVATHNFETNAANPATSVLLAVLAGGVYLVVRGLDNVEQGWSKDRLRIWFAERLTRQAKKQKLLQEKLEAAKRRLAEEALRQKQRLEEAAKQKKKQEEADARALARKNKLAAQEAEEERRFRSHVETMKQDEFEHNQFGVNVPRVIAAARQSLKPKGNPRQEKTLSELFNEQEGRNSAYSVSKMNDDISRAIEIAKNAELEVMRQPHMISSAKQAFDEIEAAEKKKFFKQYEDYMDRNK